MKKYLFGLGAMVIGAGLMLVLMLEVSPERFVCGPIEKDLYGILNCETTTMDCGISRVGISCVKKGLF